MLVRTATDIGALIRSARQDARLSQEQLAAKVGASQRWVSEIEHGKASAEIGMVLRALVVLGVEIDAKPPGMAPADSHRPHADDDIDLADIVDKAPTP
jgi:HTH-type transcriptional regulator / antitoxin HipB